MDEHQHSDAWRKRTLARMEALGIDRAHIVERTGLRNIAVHDALRWSIDVSLEVASPINDLLDQLEKARSGAGKRGALSLHSEPIAALRQRGADG
jgi:hypothetical protein